MQCKISLVDCICQNFHRMPMPRKILMTMLIGNERFIWSPLFSDGSLGTRNSIFYFRISCLVFMHIQPWMIEIKKKKRSFYLWCSIRFDSDWFWVPDSEDGFAPITKIKSSRFYFRAPYTSYVLAEIAPYTI